MSVREGQIHFTLAGPEHDADIRRLLRECPMPGSISLSLQKEPDYFAAVRMEAPEHQTAIALRGRDVVAMGSVSIHERFYNGQAVRMGYLGGLRVHPSVAGRFDIIRRGYQFLQQSIERLNLQILFTSIAADNLRARQLLEHGLPGMPTYSHVGDLSTVILPSRPGAIAPSIRPAEQLDLPDVISTLNQSSSRFQFAPQWQSLENSAQEFLLATDNEGIIACAGLWDQRQFKQAIVTAYPLHLRFFRPIYNALCGLFGRLPLPRAGQPISQAFVSHLACPDDRPDLFLALIDAISAKAYDRGIALLAIGLDDRDPKVNLLRNRYANRIYRTRIYTVAWSGSAVAMPDGRLMYPEIALL